MSCVEWVDLKYLMSRMYALGLPLIDAAEAAAHDSNDDNDADDGDASNDDDCNEAGLSWLMALTS